MEVTFSKKWNTQTYSKPLRDHSLNLNPFDYHSCLVQNGIAGRLPAWCAVGSWKDSPTACSMAPCRGNTTYKNTGSVFRRVSGSTAGGFDMFQALNRQSWMTSCPRPGRPKRKQRSQRSAAAAASAGLQRLQTKRRLPDR